MTVSSTLLTKDKIEARTGMKVTNAINAERAVLIPNTEQGNFDYKKWSQTYAIALIVRISPCLSPAMRSV